MSDAIRRGIEAAPKSPRQNPARRSFVNGGLEPEAPVEAEISGAKEQPSSFRTTPAAKARLEVMAFPWVGQVIRCEALGERSGLMIVVEGSDWLGRATLSWSINDGEGGRTEFIICRRGLSQRESERDFLSRREHLRDQ